MIDPKPVDTLVIGSGPGGYMAVLRSAQLGMTTAIVERGQIGGVCTNVGCIPSKALIGEAHRFKLHKQWNRTVAAASFEDAQAFKQAVVNKQAGGVQYLLKTAGVMILEGEASLIDEHTASIQQAGDEQRISFKNVILATGSRPIELEALPYGGRIMSSTEALSLSQIPSRGHRGVNPRIGACLGDRNGSDRRRFGDDNPSPSYVRGSDYGGRRERSEKNENCKINAGFSRKEKPFV